MITTKKLERLRYKLYYWSKPQGIVVPHRTLEEIPFKTLKEAQEYLAITSKEDNAYILDTVTGKTVN